MTNIIDFDLAKIAELTRLRDLANAKTTESAARLAQLKASMHQMLLDIRLQVYDRLDPGQRATLETRLGAIHLAIANGMDIIPLAERMFDGLDISDEANPED